MPNESIAPKYWRPGYDTWHLSAIPVFAALIVALAVLKSPAPVAGTGVVKPAIARVVTVVDQPAPGAILRVSLLGEVVGRAEPGARVILYYRTVTTPDKAIAETLADAVGVFRFRLAGFPPGSYGLHAAAVWPDGKLNHSIEIPFRVVPDPAPPTAADRKKKKGTGQR